MTWWSDSILQVSAAVAVALLLWYRYLTCTYGKWKGLGVPGPEPEVFFGNFADIVKGRTPLVAFVHQLYNRYHGRRYFGVYGGREPLLIIRDPGIVHDVMVKDFSSFYDRTADDVSFKHDKLFNHLFNMRGEQWKALRSKLSPTFTTTKLRSMMADINDCSRRLIDNLNEQITKNNGIVDVSEVSAQLTTDTIGRCAFGLDCNSLADPNSEFRRAGRDIFKTTWKIVILDFIRTIGLGRLLDLFRMRGLPDHIYDFFDNLLETTMKQHESGENSRNDFISVLVKLKNDEKQNEQNKKLFTDDILSANTFIFFVAGYETSASTISYCLYELAKNQEVQEKLRQQIMETLYANDGKLSYDIIKDMKYMDMVINETLRMHPPVPVLNRVCSKKYTIADSNVTFNVGDKLMIPIYALHHDPNYYPDPEVFDPERFTDENKNSRPLGTFIPFGDGPRICIGKYNYTIYWCPLCIRRVSVSNVHSTTY
uniref:Putative Cytochrome p450 n=1 Tax=Sipha flava TaxID=143950 RepID=A0A2S2QKW6_9HEMI